MKTLCCLLFLAVMGISQGEVRVRLKGQTTANMRFTEKEWETDWGSYDRGIYQGRQVQATVECTLGEAKGKLVVQWIGADPERPAKQEVIHRKEKEILLRPGFHLKENFTCIFVAWDENYAALGMRERYGFKYKGWILRVLDENGKELAGEASSANLLQKFRADEVPLDVD